MKFTKEQRHEIYKELLEKVDEPIWNNDGYYLCWKLWSRMGSSSFDWDLTRTKTRYDAIKNAFPEFWMILVEMTSRRSYTILTMNERLICLRRCIELSKPN
jgi:hypothetical protein